MSKKCDETGKECFPSQRLARIFARNRMHGARVKVYSCPSCHQFHITRSYVERNAK